MATIEIYADQGTNPPGAVVGSQCYVSASPTESTPNEENTSGDALTAADGVHMHPDWDASLGTSWYTGNVEYSHFGADYHQTQIHLVFDLASIPDGKWITDAELHVTRQEQLREGSGHFWVYADPPRFGGVGPGRSGWSKLLTGGFETAANGTATMTDGLGTYGGHRVTSTILSDTTELNFGTADRNAATPAKKDLVRACLFSYLSNTDHQVFIRLMAQLPMPGDGTSVSRYLNIFRDDAAVGTRRPHLFVTYRNATDDELEKGSLWFLGDTGHVYSGFLDDMERD